VAALGCDWIAERARIVDRVRSWNSSLVKSRLAPRDDEPNKDAAFFIKLRQANEAALFELF
jgi:hypothetical protein